MKRIWIAILALALIISAAGCAQTQEAQAADKAQGEQTTTVQTEAADYDFGALSALQKDDMTLEQMLNYAIQDEYLARQEYELIMEEYGAQKPFSNIIRAEESHIAELLVVFEANGYAAPEDNAIDYAALPASIEAAIDIGVQAEVNNIAMYEKFLSYDLPGDVRAVFEELMKGSESHLKAFERGVRGSGQGRMN